MVHGPIAIETPTSCRTPHVGFELDNGVKVIIIKDPTTQKSIAAMSINAGTHHDPPEVQGLAHFCEHMLFMGTEAYPAQGEYSRFIEQNGGHSNAWTEDASTQYYFQCANGAFEEALKMFSHFFVSPLFNPDCVEREMQAVHSEDEKNHTSDYWRVAEIRKLHLSNKVHPDSRYGNGNIHTLKTLPEEKGINVRDKLLAFYEQHYVAENAAITVYSPLEPQAVLDVIAPILGKMRNGKPTVASFGVPPLNVSADEAEIAAGTAIRRGTWVQVKGSRAEQRLTLNFPVPYSHKNFEEKPTGYASHVIGHECNGSILAVLKKEGLADALNAGAGNGVDHDHDRFSVGVSLTVEGVRQVDRVIQIIFDGIELLRRAGIVDAVYDEMIATHELAYNLTEIDNPSYHAAYCGRHANRYKSIARCITGYARATRRDDAKNMDVINRLTPNNCYFMLQLQDIDSAIDAGVAGSPGLALPVERLAVLRTRTDQTSFVHGAKFGVGIVPQEQLDAWNVTGRTLHPDLSLPAPNPYVARRFDVAPLSDQVYPTTRVLPRGKLHSKRDNRFGLPKAFFAVSILSAEAYKTPKARFFTRVAVSMLKHALTETLYFAELGAINTEIIPDLEGLGVSFGGASDKLMELARFVLGKAINTSTYTEADETVYVTNAQKNIRDLLGNYVGQPYTLATEASQVWTSVTRWDFKEVLEAAIGPHTYDNATSKPLPSFDEFKAFIGVLFGRIRYEALWLGNVTHDGAEEAATLLEELFSTKGVCAESDLPDVKSVLQIPTRADEISTPKSAVDAAAPPFGFIRHARAPNPKDPNHAVHVQIQAGPRTPRTRVLCDCTMALISSLFFEALRTNETIGYIVGCSSRPVMDTMSLVFVAQSATYDAHYVLGRIVAFLDAMPAHFAKDVTEEAFKSVIEAQKASRRDEHLSLMDEGAKHWARRDNPWGFGFRDLELAELETVTLPEIRAFAETHLSPDSPDARVLVVAYFADDESRAKFMTVEDRTGFVNLMPLRVVLKPKLTPPTGTEEIKLNAFNDPAAPRCITLYELEDRDSWRASRPTFPRSKPSE